MQLMNVNIKDYEHNLFFWEFLPVGWAALVKNRNNNEIEYNFIAL